MTTGTGEAGASTLVTYSEFVQISSTSANASSQPGGTVEASHAQTPIVRLPAKNSAPMRRAKAGSSNALTQTRLNGYSTAGRRSANAVRLGCGSPGSTTSARTGTPAASSAVT